MYVVRDTIVFTVERELKFTLILYVFASDDLTTLLNKNILQLLSELDQLYDDRHAG